MYELKIPASAFKDKTKEVVIRLEKTGKFFGKATSPGIVKCTKKLKYELVKKPVPPPLPEYEPKLSLEARALAALTSGVTEKKLKDKMKELHEKK